MKIKVGQRANDGTIDETARCVEHCTSIVW